MRLIVMDNAHLTTTRMHTGGGATSFTFYLFYIRVTGCRFVQVADSYTWSFQACTSFTMSIKKKLITRAIKQATVSTIFSACARLACRFQPMQTIIFNYQCDSVSSAAVKFRNSVAAFQHSLSILITDGEKNYPTLRYLSLL